MFLAIADYTANKSTKALSNGYQGHNNTCDSTIFLGTGIRIRAKLG